MSWKDPLIWIVMLPMVMLVGLSFVVAYIISNFQK